MASRSSSPNNEAVPYTPIQLASVLDALKKLNEKKGSTIEQDNTPCTRSRASSDAGLETEVYCLVKQGVYEGPIVQQYGRYHLRNNTKATKRQHSPTTSESRSINSVEDSGSRSRSASSTQIQPSERNPEALRAAEDDQTDRLKLSPPSRNINERRPQRQTDNDADCDQNHSGEESPGCANPETLDLMPQLEDASGEEDRRSRCEIM